MRQNPFKITTEVEYILIFPTVYSGQLGFVVIDLEWYHNNINFVCHGKLLKSGNYYLTKVTNFASTFSFHHLLLYACAACKQDLYGSICSCDSWHMNIGQIIGIGVWIWCMKRGESLSHLFM